jgi:hypothetical protein
MTAAIRFLGLALALGACAPDPDAVGRPMTGAQSPGATYLVPGDTCGAGPLQNLVGQNAGALNAAALPVESRILYPDMPAGGAFRSDRLTATVDDSDTITRIACG